MIPQRMEYSQSGMKLTEGQSKDLGFWNRMTDGYGNTHGVVPGKDITMSQAVNDLYANVQNSVNDVNNLVNVQLTQEEFDALVDFDFNLGRGNLAKSTLLKDVNAQNWADAANQFEPWDKCGGKVLAGLLRRRIAEEQLFETPPTQEGTTS